MHSLILSVASRYLLPLLTMFSIFLLVRGHNAPGGGFVGGLVAATGFTLYGIARSVKNIRRVLPVDPIVLIGSGLLIALISALIPLLAGQPFMTGLWSTYELPVLGKLGTPVFFDIGVYLLVNGIVLTIVVALSEE